MAYASFQGRVYIAERNAAGEPLQFRWVGNSPQFDLSYEPDVLEHKESWTGQRATDVRILRELEANLVLQLEDASKENFSLAMFGENTTLPTSPVTDESLAGGATDVAVGDILALEGQDVSSVVIKDSAAGTLVEGTDYRIVSADHGSIEILDLGAYTQPFLADYTPGVAENINMLTQGLTEKWVRLEGINTANNRAPVLVEIYKAAFDPTEALAFINDELLQFTLNGAALADETKSQDVTLGTFGRVVQIGANH